MKVVTILGARPQFIKAAAVSHAIVRHNDAIARSHPSLINEVIVHTGQHYDHGMSRVFFEELAISEPAINLEVGSGSQGWQTGRMLIGIEEAILAQQPDLVMVYGDTNSTLAGALAAAKMHVPLAHVEAGLRSFNRQMPEEHNRVLADHCSDILFCPTKIAVKNLQREGFESVFNHGELIETCFKNSSIRLNGPLVINVGDTMFDAVLQFSDIANKHSTILQELNLKPKEYLLTTIHRPYNTDIPENLRNILSAFIEIDEPIIFPVHPRTRQKIDALDGVFKFQFENCNLRLIDAIGYLDMLVLEKHARLIMTDSGGMQKEAYFFGVPCVTMRPETEWVETVEEGWNVVVGSETASIIEKSRKLQPPESSRGIFGDGHAGERIVHTIENFCSYIN